MRTGKRSMGRDAAILIVVCVAAMRLIGFFEATDAHAYYIAQLASPYTLGPAHTDAYLYSPAFLDVLAPFQLLPWPLFEAIWTLIIGLAVIATTGRWALVVIVMGVGDLLFGNVNLLIGAALVASFRYPAAWSFIVLTKVTPGIGLLWLAARREWRALAIALGATATLITLSVLADAEPWAGWINILGVGAAHPYQCSDTSLQCILFQPPLIVRLAGAALLTVWGARTGRRWVLPLAVGLALPVLWGGALFAIVAYALPLAFPDGPMSVLPRLRQRLQGPTEPIPSGAAG
jgi:hypothetical protein